MDRQALLTEGAACYAVGDFAAAEAAYRAILAQCSGDAEALSNLAAILTATERPAEAEAACRAALQAKPRYWAALANLGNALHRQLRYEEAVNAYHAAVEANPRNASAWTNLGVALNEQQAMAESLIAHGAAVALAPNDPQIRVNHAMALLMAGNYENGFAAFEWRWRTPGMAPHGMAAPPWRGSDPAQRTILLHHEGGFGDTLQFIRYAPLLAARGARVIAQVQAPLATLLRRSFPAVTVVPETSSTPPHDLHCPMLSLPASFGTALATIPATIPYLLTDDADTARWRARLPAEGLKVGLVWAGAPLLGVAEFRAMNSRRSLRLAAFAPLAGIGGVHLVSLQYGGSSEAAQPPPGMALLDAMGSITDFDGTASLVATLDLVITVDSAVAHLAGALGKAVWVLSRYDACWRWLANRRDSPWYPSLRLYRQTRPGDWRDPLAEIEQDLQALARTSLPGSATQPPLLTASQRANCSP